MNPDFVNGIHDPQRLPLQELQLHARSVVKGRLDEYGMDEVPEHVLTKLTYAYYHDWQIDDPDYLFLLADPGVPGEHVVFETNAYVELGEEYDFREAIQVDRRFGARWLTKRDYADFTAEFIRGCRNNNLIDTNLPWWRYLLSGNFFDDFYMGDVIKYRGANVGSGDIDTSFTEFLIHELEYVEPSLIFAFGKLAWEALADHLQANPVDEPPSSERVVDRHGVLHHTDRLIDTLILPLGHPSRNFRGAQISQERYMEGVLDGLREFRDLF